MSQLVYMSRAVGQLWLLHSYHMTRPQQDTVASRVPAGDRVPKAARQKTMEVFFYFMKVARW